MNSNDGYAIQCRVNNNKVRLNAEEMGLLCVTDEATSPTHGPLTRYVKLRVAHAPSILGTFSPRPISKETAS